jgi:hypothetical protein
MDVVNLQEKLANVHEYWSPKIADEVSDSYVKLVKLRGEFVIIPRGVDHLPVVEEEVHVLLIEPKSTLNTGNIQDERTLPVLQRI